MSAFALVVYVDVIVSSPVCHKCHTISPETFRRNRHILSSASTTIIDVVFIYTAYSHQYRYNFICFLVLNSQRACALSGLGSARQRLIHIKSIFNLSTVCRFSFCTLCVYTYYMSVLGGNFVRKTIWAECLPYLSGTKYPVQSK